MTFRNPPSAEEKALLERARRRLPGAQLGNITSAFEDGFIVKEGRGSKLYDFSGNEYIDYLIGVGAYDTGARSPRRSGRRAGVAGQRQHLLHHQRAGHRAGGGGVPRRSLCTEKVRFTTSGTDATFQCLRAARAFTKRDKISEVRGRVSRHPRLRP